MNAFQFFAADERGFVNLDRFELSAGLFGLALSVIFIVVGGAGV